MPKVFFVDDGPGKPEGINHFIGRRPIFAFGNSDGDKEMLEWTEAGDGLRFMGLVYHTDAAREYAYGPASGLPNSKVGTFSQALMDEAKSKGWIIADMKKRLEDDLPACQGEPLSRSSPCHRHSGTSGNPVARNAPKKTGPRLSPG